LFSSSLAVMAGLTAPGEKLKINPAHEDENVAPMRHRVVNYLCASPTDFVGHRVDGLTHVSAFRFVHLKPALGVPPQDGGIKFMPTV